MKFSIRHLLSLMFVVALGVQAVLAYRMRQRIEWVEFGRDWAEDNLRKVEASRRPEYELCKQVEQAYEYPGDYAAAERRFARLQAGEAKSE